MAAKPQSFASHARLDPPFHYFMVPVALITLVVVVWMLVREPSLYNTWKAVAALAAVTAVFKIRLYALKVQDRLIRLEERLRLNQVLSDPLRARINDLSEDQLIGLRFAADAELPALVEKTLANNWGRKEIKQAITNWRPDFFRV